MPKLPVDGPIMVCSPLDLSRQFALHQRGVRRAHLVAARRKVPADHHHDVGVHAGQFLGKKYVADFVASVLPGNVIKVRLIEFVATRCCCPLSQHRRKSFRVQHFLVCRTEDLRFHQNFFLFSSCSATQKYTLPIAASRFFLSF